MRTTVMFFTTLVSLSAAAAESALPTAIPVDLENFQETFDDTPAVSGSALVALSLGAFADALNIGDVRIVAPPSGTSSLCVRVTTRDGRFSASNPYVVSPSLAESIRLSVLTRKYSKPIANYRPDALAIRAYIADSKCSPRDAVHLPQLQSDGDVTRLIVMVNTSTRRTIAELTGPSGEVSYTECIAPSDAALIAFDKLCLIERRDGDMAGLHSLLLKFDDGFGIETFNAQVLLPDLK